jgi:hypothetical protein
MKSIPLAIGLMLLFCAVPVQAQTVTGAQKAEIEKAVKEKVAQMYDSLDALNAESYVRLWSQDKIMGSLSPTGLEKNLETMKKAIQGYTENAKSRKTESLATTVHALSPEMALAFSNTTFRAEGKNENSGRFYMANTTIWVKDSGGWKLAFSATAMEQKR